MEESNGGSNKENAVSKPNHPKCKNNKKTFQEFYEAQQNQKQFKGKKGPCFVCEKLEHYVRECRYRKDHKWAIVNAIDEEITATLSNTCVVQGKVQDGSMILVPLFMSPITNLFSRPLKMQMVIKRSK